MIAAPRGRCPPGGGRAAATPGWRGSCVCLLFAYRNAEHELRVEEIVEEEQAKRRADEPGARCFLSSELYPHAPGPAAAQLDPDRGLRGRALARHAEAVRDQTKEAGAGFELRVMASHGGTISIEARELARTLASGPIGGVVGGQATRRAPRGSRTSLCTDIGGTSFDIALITDGGSRSPRRPTSRASCSTCRWSGSTRSAPAPGSFVRVNPNSGRPELGPDSAGARIGVCWPEGGLETISVTDLNLVLGRVNPDYFLGGDVKLDPERARAEVGRQLAEPLGLEVDDAAAGVDRAVRADAEERGGRPDPGQGLLARRLRAALLRRRRAPARRRLHATASPTATSSCPPGRPASPPTAAPAPTSSTATT